MYCEDCGFGQIKQTAGELYRGSLHKMEIAAFTLVRGTKNIVRMLGCSCRIAVAAPLVPPTFRPWHPEVSVMLDSRGLGRSPIAHISSGNGGEAALGSATVLLANSH